ncbi:outer membrane lipoprotein-sorting protein [Aquimarina brevivitae]|uniref:Outer membrane lipoprotein-sorting protein n=1 Tax=Aquimarina brevivitae TaxID=323412 RepID=A0A4Q7NUD2_9FLAO|nr:outer membrane lipoprotein-sorting protein [Aquimarina brevivitae]RZS90458.1 hypothetical protein EV197_3444 [Aquimarina brevivitae]
MNTLKTLIVALVLAIIAPANAQDVDEILTNYFENTGGIEKWKNLEGVKMVGVMKMQGMEIPFEQVMLKDGKQATKIDLQGQKMTWSAYDGETSWTRNQMTMEPEKNDSEANQNMKNLAKEWPSPFLNYKDKGFTVELVGKETVDGTEAFKIKVVKDPVVKDGQEIPNISHYYFDTENFVPIVIEEEVQDGPMKGQTVKMIVSDYQEVDGLYFPFSQSNQFQSMEFKEFVLNPEIEESLFVFPEGK